MQTTLTIYLKKKVVRNMKLNLERLLASKTGSFLFITSNEVHVHTGGTAYLAIQTRRA